MLIMDRKWSKENFFKSVTDKRKMMNFNTYNRRVYEEIEE